jgi:hypothetical protein
MSEPTLNGQRAQLPYHHGVRIACFTRRRLELLERAGVAWLRQIERSVIGRPCTSPGGVPAPNPPTGVSPVTSPGRCGVFRSVTAASSGAARPCGGQQPHPCSRPRRPAWIQVLPRLGAGHDEDPESVATRADLPRSPRQNGCHRPLRRQRPQARRNHGGSCRTRALSVEGLLFVNRADWAHCFDAVASVPRSEAVRSDLLVGACKSCGAQCETWGALCLPTSRAAFQVINFLMFLYGSHLALTGHEPRGGGDSHEDLASDRFLRMCGQGRGDGG